MKIAIFCETYLPYINGVVTHIHALKTGLEMLGNQVLIVTADPKVSNCELRDSVLHCPSREIKKLYGYGLASPFGKIRYKYLDQFAPDIIHIHQEFGIGLFGYRYAKSRHIPYVYTMHTMYDDYIYYVVPKYIIPVMKRAAGKYMKLFASHAAAITGPSKKVESYLRHHGLYKRVHVIPNPVELDKFDRSKFSPKDADQLRQQYGFSNEDFLVAFVGRIGKEKNIDLLLNNWKSALSKHPDVKLVVMGGGPGLEELTKYKDKLGLQNQCFFLGSIPHEELGKYLYMCDMYVTASLSDTNSISMLEAMAIGLPVAHIQDELNAGQVTEGVNGFIYTNANEMAYKILAFRANQDKDSLRKSTMQSVAQKGYLTLGKNLLDIYTDVLARVKK